MRQGGRQGAGGRSGGTAEPRGAHKLASLILPSGHNPLRSLNTNRVRALEPF